MFAQASAPLSKLRQTVRSVLVAVNAENRQKNQIGGEKGESQGTEADGGTALDSTAPSHFCDQFTACQRT